MAYIVNDKFPDELLNEFDVNWQTDGTNHDHGVILKWTTEPPTVAGWYWYIYPKSLWSIEGLDKPMVFHIKPDGENLLCLVGGKEVDLPPLDNRDGFWLGPLPTPEPPQ